MPGYKKTKKLSAKQKKIAKMGGNKNCGRASRYSVNSPR